MKKTSWLFTAVISLLLLPRLALAEENTNTSLTVGAIRDQAETAVVRILAKYGDGFGVTDKIVPVKIEDGRGSFNNLSRSFEIDATDQGKYGGLSFRYGVKHYNIGLKTDPNAPARADGQPVVKFDGDKLMHVFPVHIGIDTDKNIKNHDYLVEVGYIPAYFKSGTSCFKLGANPIVGISGQIGHRKRVAEATASGESPEPSGSLRRIKIEGKLDFPLSCLFNLPTNSDGKSNEISDLLFTDIGRWQVIASSTGWRDFSEDRNYKKHVLTLRIPTSDKAFIDLKREIGASPTNFDTGAKFSANLTIDF